MSRTTDTRNGTTVSVPALIWTCSLVADGNTDGDRVDEIVSDALTGKQMTYSDTGEAVDLPEVTFGADGDTVTLPGDATCSLAEVLAALDNVYTAGSLDAAAEQCARALAYSGAPA